MQSRTGCSTLMRMPPEPPRDVRWMERKGSPGPMTCRGYWIVCRCCSFPIRLPQLLKVQIHPNKAGLTPILLACPVCAHVEPYNGTELKPIAFRIPDPFDQKKAALYQVEVPCGTLHCEGKARIFAMAAASVSITALLKLWKHWAIRARCHGHLLKPRRCSTWGVYGVHQVYVRNSG